MFAGPNGSGKSLLKQLLRPSLLGVYLNPDELEKQVRLTGYLNLNDYGVTAECDEILSFFRNSPLLFSQGLNQSCDRLAFTDDRLDFSQITINSYFASVAIDFIQRKLIASKQSFTLETVMSHPSKIDLLANAKKEGYRTYLYYIATDDPSINVERVRLRVESGGHDVPENRIISRYHRSLGLLSDAIKNTNRAFIFDNSGNNLGHTFLAEITDGADLTPKSTLIPAWFKQYVLDKFQS
jgi:predicted ABC-type ATPase